MVALELFTSFNCFPVFLGADLKERYYKGQCRHVTVHLQLQASRLLVVMGISQSQDLHCIMLMHH